MVSDHSQGLVDSTSFSDPDASPERISWGGFRKRNLNHGKPSVTCGWTQLPRAKCLIHLPGALDLVAL